MQKLKKYLQQFWILIRVIILSKSLHWLKNILVVDYSASTIMHFSTKLLTIVLFAIFAENIRVFAKPNRRKLKGKSDSELTLDVQKGINKINMDFVKVLLNDVRSDENFAFSPLNLYSSLALVHLGATGTTKTELSNLLELPVEDDQLVRAHQSIGDLLDRMQKSTFLDNASTLNIAKGIFARKGLQLNEEYVKRMNDYYKGGIQQLDFKRGGSEATNAINRWIAEKTKNEMMKFEGQLPKETEMVLASVLHIDEAWPEFNKSVEKKTFNTGIKSIEVETMFNKQIMPYFNNENLKFEALGVPHSPRESDTYKGFSMLIVLPYEDQSIKSLINTLEPGQFWETIDSLQCIDVNCEIPIFKLRSAHVTKQQLKKLGVKQMFTRAQLGNMLNSRNIKISQVVHEVDIDVHQKGITGGHSGAIPPIGAPSSENGEVQFNANRPFLFSIYHQDTRTILFTGFVQNPGNKNAK